jgi:uncharacterized repeat protein (TIGR01451 family)
MQRSSLKRPPRARSLSSLLVVLGLVDAAFTAPSAQAAPPAIQLTKTADAATATAGSQIGYTISATNPSSNKASILITDPLPTNPGTAWSVSPANSSCTIAGTLLTCTAGQLPAGATFSVHIVSPTTVSTCGTVGKRRPRVVGKSPRREHAADPHHRHLPEPARDERPLTRARSTPATQSATRSALRTAALSPRPGSR